VNAFPRWLLAALAWGALTGGARFPWAYWPLALACAALGLWALVTERGWRHPDVRRVLIACAAIGIAILVQLVPLPHAIFAKVNPAADRFLAEYAVTYSLSPPAFHTLSISPSATRTALLLFLALAVMLCGLLSVLRRIRLDTIAAGLTGLGVALAVIGVVQRAALGTEPLVYGIWRATPLSSPFGPFLNRNHYAGWMVMALPIALAYACAVLQQARRPHGTIGDWLRWSLTPQASRFLVGLFAVLAMATALIVTGSRSGMAAFAGAMLVFGLLTIRRTGRRASRWLVGAALAGLVLAAVVWAGPRSIADRFAVVQADLPGRLTAWRDTLTIAREFPVFGTGLGTFGAAMIVYQTGSRIAIYSQAHNDYLQLAAEGGLLVGVPVVALAVLLVRQGRRRLRASDRSIATAGREAAQGAQGAQGALSGWLRLGAIAGLAGIAAQSFVEYSLQPPGNTALCVVLMALAVHRAPEPGARTGAYADRL
jgi:O-antigen ligase